MTDCEFESIFFDDDDEISNDDVGTTPTPFYKTQKFINIILSTGLIGLTAAFITNTVLGHDKTSYRSNENMTRKYTMNEELIVSDSVLMGNKYFCSYGADFDKWDYQLCKNQCEEDASCMGFTYHADPFACAPWDMEGFSAHTMYNFGQAANTAATQMRSQIGGLLNFGNIECVLNP